MATSEELAGTVSVENVGGIEKSEVHFDGGVTVLAGRNATNRTSFLTAVIAALGGHQASLRAGADSGSVELTLGGDTYTRTFHREEGTVVSGGDPYLTDSTDVELAELFAFLLESNEARRAVAMDEDLRELMFRPVDTDAIQAEIDRLIRDRNRIDDELQTLDDLANDLPALEERRQELRGEIGELEDRLAEKRAELEAAEADPDVQGQTRSELDDAMEELQATRNEFTHTRRQIETERESIASLEAERDDLQQDLDELPEPEAVAEVESRLESLRTRKDTLENVLSEIQRVIEFNEKLLDGGADGITDVLDTDETEELTAELLPESQTVCWTCGSTVERAEIADTLERLRSVRTETMSERSAVRDEIDELTAKVADHEERKAERARLERRVERTATELTERRERVAELEAEKERIAEDIEELESRVSSLQAAEQDELIELNRAVNEIEFEREQRRSELESVDAEIAEIEDQLADREELENDRAIIEERLQDQRGRIEEIESEAVESFNEAMEDVLEIVEYDNLERIWIDRRSTDGESRFDLRVVRADDDGAVFQDSVANLSESEREVTGLVFALAGYLVHDVHETVPIMVLDSLEAIDGVRIARLIDYFVGYADTLMVALLPDDADAVDDEYTYIRDI